MTAYPLLQILFFIYRLNAGDPGERVYRITYGKGTDFTQRHQ